MKFALFVQSFFDFLHNSLAYRAFFVHNTFFPVPLHPVYEFPVLEVSYFIPSVEVVSFFVGLAYLIENSLVFVPGFYGCKIYLVVMVRVIVSLTECVVDEHIVSLPSHSGTEEIDAPILPAVDDDTVVFLAYFVEK